MSIKTFIFGDKGIVDEVGKKSTQEKSDTVTNPYLKGAEGRKEWDDRQSRLSKEIWNWKRAFFMMGGVALALAVGLVIVGSQSKIKPFAVELKDGVPVNIKSMAPMYTEDQKVIYAAIVGFIINARTISSDTNTEQAVLNNTYAFSAGNTLNYLRDYYQANDPFKIAAQYTVTPSIINALPTGKNTWQVMWEETQRDTVNNQPIGTTQWIANVTYQFGETNPKYVTVNPLGFYITQVSWSQSQGKVH